MSGLPRLIRLLPLAALALAGGCGSSHVDHDGASGLRTVKVALAPDGCVPARFHLAPGTTQVQVSNLGTESELEVKDHKGIVVGDLEFLLPGKGGLSLELHPGTYVFNCSNGARVGTAILNVTGQDHHRSGAAASGQVRISATLQGPSERAGDERARVSLDPSRGELCWDIDTIVARPTYAQIHDRAGRTVATFAKPWTHESCGHVDPSVLRAVAAQPHDYLVDVHSRLRPHGAVRGRF